MANLSLSAVSVGVYTALNVAGLMGLTPRIYDDIPRDPVYPLVVYEVDKERTRVQGTSELAMVNLRVSALSKSATLAEAQAICEQVENLLFNATLTVSGYRMAGTVFHADTIKIGQTEINGEKVNEFVALFYFWLEPSA